MSRGTGVPRAVGRPMSRGTVPRPVGRCPGTDLVSRGTLGEVKPSGSSLAWPPKSSARVPRDSVPRPEGLSRVPWDDVPRPAGRSGHFCALV